MTTHEDRIRSYFAACSSGSGDDVASHFTEDAVIYDTNHPPIVSSAHIGNFWVQIHDKWIGANWVVERVVENGDSAAIEWCMEGEHQGNTFQVRGSEHYDFREGLIAEIRQYWTFDPQSPGGGLTDYPYGQPNRLGSDES
ncbi:MAG: nuclear transport factor 2 family protein [Actinomycetota bacterium]|jgi:ketosteroid isomerase-like protein|nr:hypothetical protein [Acidimicrobiaceae bacterium]MEC7916662.1 nuclear transport factor 2 family protein [Actinomycetota bacterium]MED5361102.1 nuclear transport factor 2 family protein [Actinomycetota bacterium]MEE3256146.1 nuclear transport factor 2 family protein [Actinomycetota bacterium]|tara:strand:+ start:423 stop:842 length:420 start_codon:yes stop_codon:yes gene_type:complete